MIRLTLLGQTWQELSWLFSESAPDEQGVFCLLRKGKGTSDSRLLAGDLLLPPPDAWEHQGKGILRPRAQWISAAVSCAIRAHAGLLFVHSHPDPHFPLGLSQADIEAFESLGRHLSPTLEGSFAAAVVHPHGWAGAVWTNDAIVPIERVSKVGRTLQLLSPHEYLQDIPMDARQRDALGIIHDRVRSLTVAIVGCGGVGSPIAEQLIRMGVGQAILIDRGYLDTPSDVRRTFGSRRSDLEVREPQRKVDVIGRHLDSLEMGASIRRVHGDVRTEEVFRHLLDADVVMLATDDHGSRAVVNDLASAYFIPVIDVGTRAGSKEGKSLAALVAEVRILTPTTPCLWCRKTINGDVIRSENLPEGERQMLAKENYLIGGLQKPEPSVTALTVLGSGLATCSLLALLSEEGEVARSTYWVDGFLGDSREGSPTEPIPGCRCRTQLGLGDCSPPPFIGSGPSDYGTPC